MAMEAILLLIAWGLSAGILLLGTFLTLRHFKGHPPHLDAPFGLYPVSILKPLKGVDEGLEENLKSFFKLDYPLYELLFSVADARDPAVTIVKSIMAEFPEIPARLIVGDQKIGPNPKVNNLIRSYDSSQHDLVLISDSNVRVPANYLKRMIAHLDNSTGLITAVVNGAYPVGMGGHLESIYLNTFFARGMKLAFWAGKPCVVGKSMLFFKSTAERFGGLKTLGKYLAEDYMAGEAMKKLGLKTILMTDPVDQYLGVHRFSDFWSRHIRWGRIRKSQAPLVFPLEILQNSIITGFLGALGCDLLISGTFLSFWIFHMSLWAFCDFSLMMHSEKSNFGVRSILYWFVREVLGIVLFIQILMNNRVHWRGQTLKLEVGGLVEVETHGR